MGNVLTAECRIIDRHINERGAALHGFNGISQTQNVSSLARVDWYQMRIIGFAKQPKKRYCSLSLLRRNYRSFKLICRIYCLVLEGEHKEKLSFSHKNTKSHFNSDLSQISQFESEKLAFSNFSGLFWKISCRLKISIQLDLLCPQNLQIGSSNKPSNLQQAFKLYL